MACQLYPRFPARVLCAIVFATMLAPGALAKWKEQVLYSFQGLPDGATPAGGVVFDQQGNLYGATTDGGANNCPGIAQCGTVYQLAPPIQKGGSWTESLLYVFQGKNSDDGETPAGGVIIDTAGNLYGTTAYGGNGPCILLGTRAGCGIVYELSPPTQKGGQWTYTILYNFQGGSDGYFPWGDLVFDQQGSIYGATQFGGGKGTTCDPIYQYCGTVFKMSPPKKKGGKWTEKVLHGFKSGKDGANPNGGLVLDSEGTIYGTSQSGGDQQGECSPNGCGTVFALEPPTKKGGAWTEQMLYRFHGQDGATPAAGVRFGSNGDLYGTAYAGANSAYGAVFRLAPMGGRGHWKETMLYRFSDGNDGANPEGALIFDAMGNLYGTTNVGSGGSLRGNVFRLKPPERKGGVWTLTNIHGFTKIPDGENPTTSLTFDKAGNLYGATQYGGTGSGCSFTGCGAVFEVSP